MYRCTIIGISDSPTLRLSSEAMAVIARSRFFSGGKRHHALVAHLLPEESRWVDITIPLQPVLEQYEQVDEVVVFASGDPLFYGFAATLRRAFPTCHLEVFPSFHSLQLLAHRLTLPYGPMRTVSLTGRPWNGLDEALIRGEQLIGVLTDRRKTPEAIHDRMHAYGYDNYRMYVGECLGSDTQERVSLFQPGRQYAHPNCLILERTGSRTIPWGLPDTQFDLLDGRTRMLTKMPIRLCTLAALELKEKRVLWDIGFCTGSVSIEAKLHFPHLHVIAFEKRAEGHQLMESNTRRFGTPGIDTFIGDFFDMDLTSLEQPDAVFIGGHGGRLKEMVTHLHPLLREDGCIVFNSVTEESLMLFQQAAMENGLTCEHWHTIQVDDHNPITILRVKSRESRG